MALAYLAYAHGNFADAVKLLNSLAKGPNSPVHRNAAKIKLAEINIGDEDIDAAAPMLADPPRQDGRDAAGLAWCAAASLERGHLR